MHCLLTDSPPDSPEEIAAVGRNQHRTAACGREPGLLLERGHQKIALTDWGQDIVSQCAPIAARLDAVHGISLYSEALAAAVAALADPDSLPSARVLAAMQNDHGNSFVKFVRDQSEKTRELLLGLPYPEQLDAQFTALTAASMADQKRMELLDSLPFDEYLHQYMAAERLNVPRRMAAMA